MPEKRGESSNQATIFWPIKPRNYLVSPSTLSLWPKSLENLSLTLSDCKSLQSERIHFPSVFFKKHKVKHPFCWSIMLVVSSSSHFDPYLKKKLCWINYCKVWSFLFLCLMWTHLLVSQNAWSNCQRNVVSSSSSFVFIVNKKIEFLVSCLFLPMFVFSKIQAL